MFDAADDVAHGFTRLLNQPCTGVSTRSLEAPIRVLISAPRWRYAAPTNALRQPPPQTRPCSPARAASTAALSAKILVWKAMPSITPDDFIDATRGRIDLGHIGHHMLHHRAPFAGGLGRAGGQAIGRTRGICCMANRRGQLHHGRRCFLQTGSRAFRTLAQIPDCPTRFRPMRCQSTVQPV